MVRPVAGLYDRVRHLVPELAKFGVVGCVGAVIDLGGAAVLHGRYHQGPLTAKALSIGAATVVTYMGSRFWTFRHRENQPLLREGVLFVALNVVGLIIAEAVIACTTYLLGYKDPIAYNVASLVGTGLGTIFRYFAYRQWVFLAPAAQPAQQAVPQPVPAFASSSSYASSYAPGSGSGSGSRSGSRSGFASWEQEPWEPAEEPTPSTLPSHKSGQVKLPNRGRAARTASSPLVATAGPTWPAAPAWPPVFAGPDAPAGTGPRPAQTGTRPPGRHRKPR